MRFPIHFSPCRSHALSAWRSRPRDKRRVLSTAAHWLVWKPDMASPTNASQNLLRPCCSLDRHGQRDGLLCCVRRQAMNRLISPSPAGLSGVGLGLTASF